VLKIAVFCLKALHLAILLFSLSGWLLPANLLWIYVLWIPAMVVQWQLNQGTCLLTNLENFLVPAARKEKPQQQGQLIKSLFLLCCDCVPGDRALKYLVYVTLGACWSIGCLRWYFDRASN
jgi:hypothetical protein